LPAALGTADTEHDLPRLHGLCQWRVDSQGPDSHLGIWSQRMGLLVTEIAALLTSFETADHRLI